jgi:hypothetical protein
MARPALPELHRLKAAMPIGVAGFWSVIRARDTEGPWSIPDVEGETNRPRNAIGNYVRALAKAGIARPAGERRTKYGRPIKLYRLAKSPKDAPRLRSDGSPAASAVAQDQMWRAMRTLRQFSCREIAFISGEAEPIPLRTAQWYCHALAAAGYLVIVDERRPTIYRLRPANDTGPKAPRVMSVGAVFDENTGEVRTDLCCVAEVTP